MTTEKKTFKPRPGFAFQTIACPACHNDVPLEMTSAEQNWVEWSGDCASCRRTVVLRFWAMEEES